jgi:hypothetical protein
MIQSPQIFQVQWFLRYTAPTSVFSTFANTFGGAEARKNAMRLWKLVWRARLIVENFQYFTTNEVPRPHPPFTLPVGAT